MKTGTTICMSIVFSDISISQQSLFLTVCSFRAFGMIPIGFISDKSTLKKGLAVIGLVILCPCFCIEELYEFRTKL